MLYVGVELNYLFCKHSWLHEVIMNEVKGYLVSEKRTGVYPNAPSILRGQQWILA